MRAVESFKRRYRRSPLQKAWHRFAPSVTVSRRFRGVRVYLDFRDNVDELTMSAGDLAVREWPVLEVPAFVDGPIWDVGANVGLFAVSASRAGRSCVAFEQSPKAVALLRRTARNGGLDIAIVERAFTTVPISYEPSDTARTTNAVAASEDGPRTSVTFLEAEREYGSPALIKMDIEGGETEFFASDAFKTWLAARGVLWLVEVHARQGAAPAWSDLPCAELAPRQFLYGADERAVDALATRCAAVERPR